MSKSSEMLRRFYEQSKAAGDTLERVTGHRPNQVLMGYEIYCALRGDEPNPELAGWTVEIRDGEARLVTWSDDADGLVGHPDDADLPWPPKALP